MMVRSGMGMGLFLWPDQQALLGHLIDQGQQFDMPLDQDGASALVTAIFGGPLTDPCALVVGNGVEPVLALLAAGQDVGRVKLAASTTAVGFAAFAPEQIEGALDHRFGALEAAQRLRNGGIGSPELLAEARQFFTQSASVILQPIQIASEKNEQNAKNRPGNVSGEKSAPFTRFYAPFPHCLNCRTLRQPAASVGEAWTGSVEITVPLN